MPFIAKSVTVGTNNVSSTLDFGVEIDSWIAGVAGFQYSYKDDDHHIEELGLSITVTSRTVVADTQADASSASDGTPASSTTTTYKTVFDVSARGTMQDLSQDYLDDDASTVTVTVLGYSGMDPGNIALMNLGSIGVGGSGSTSDLGFYPSVGFQAVLSGFALSYGADNGDQHLMDEMVEVQQSISGNTVRVTGSAEMEDAGGNKQDDSLSDVSAALVAIGGTADTCGIEFQYVQSQDATCPVHFKNALTSAGAFLISEKVAYSRSDDYHVQSLVVGPTALSIDTNDPTTVTVSHPGGSLADHNGAHNQDNSLTQVKLLVVGCFTPTPSSASS